MMRLDRFHLPRHAHPRGLGAVANTLVDTAVVVPLPEAIEAPGSGPLETEVHTVGRYRAINIS